MQSVKSAEAGTVDRFNKTLLLFVKHTNTEAYTDGTDQY